jgi:hypothetical protein
VSKSTRQIKNRKKLKKQQFFCRVLFSDTRQRLCRVSKSTRQIKNRKKLKKTAIFFKILGTTLQPYLSSITLPTALTFFTIILNEIYMFYMVRFELATSLAHTLLYHYTTTPIMSILRFHYLRIITNRE